MENEKYFELFDHGNKVYQNLQDAYQNTSKTEIYNINCLHQKGRKIQSVKEQKTKLNSSRKETTHKKAEINEIEDKVESSVK